MFRLVDGFAAQMCKRAVGSEGESTPISDGKRPKQSSPDEEAQKDCTIILVDSPNQASNNQSVLEGTPSEAGAPLEEGVPTGGASNVDEIGEASPLGVVAAPIHPPKPTNIVFSRKRPPD